MAERRRQRVSARHCEIPDRVVDRIIENTLMGALHVPRAKLPCDIWIGGLNGTGRPRIDFGYDGVTVAAMVSQLVWRLHYNDGEPIPEGYVVCHTCDVPTCVNPFHLYLGTPQHNGSDLKHRGSRTNQGIARREVKLLLKLWEGRTPPIWVHREADRFGL